MIFMKKDTSWGNVAGWYDDLLRGDDTYQEKVIAPNILRLLAPKSGQKILDLACGQGFFARQFAKSGAEITGLDISKELIDFAKKGAPINCSFFVGKAESFPFLEDGSFDSVVCILAVQNIENVQSVFSECNRVLKKNGRLLLVLNHPAFRIPKFSSWGIDEENSVQYRRVDRYLSESRAEILMHPGSSEEKTVSFHRSLQYYFKALGKYGFCVCRLEEWNSHRQSDKGPRQKMENEARKEIPLFLFLESIKCFSEKN